MAVSQGTQFNSSVGRIVWGNPAKLEQRTDVNNKPIFKDDGTPSMGVAFGLAIPKQQFLANEWPLMQAEAAKGFQNGVPANFSWKLKDGDTDKDSNGNPLSAKEGYAGCYILTISSNTGYPCAVYKFNGSTYDQLTVEQIKTGYWICVSLNVQLNIPQQKTHTPSLYINPQAVELVAFDKEIISTGVNPMQAFGGRQHQLPPGASATPIGGAGAGVQMPGVGGMPGNPMQPGGAPQGMPQYGNPAGMPGNGMPNHSPNGQNVTNAAYPSSQPQGYPQQQQQPMQQAPGQMPPPAHDFVQQPPMQQPGQMPGYPAQQPQGYPQQQMPGGAPMGGMPGQMPSR